MSAERSLGLAGSFVKGRYRVNAVSAVSRDVVVYAAEEVRFGRPVTLRVLRDEVAADAEFVAAVKEQAGTLGISAHADRGLPRVYEYGVTDTGAPFVALEQTKGATLREVLDARGALDSSTALRIASQVGEALETLHHDRILHGQLDPESILLVRDDDGGEHVALLGVELTSAYRTAAGRRRRDAAPPPYLAPEQVASGETTGASDQYALGMLLRELLTAGKADETTLPPEIARIIATALSPEPARRFPDISVMVNDMWAAQTGLPEPEPRVRPVGVRTHALKRRRQHTPVIGLRIAAAVAAAGIIAVVVWFAISGGLAARFGAQVPTPDVVPVVQDAPPPPTQPLPAAPEPEPKIAESHPVKNVSTDDALTHPAAAPRPAPVVERQEPPTPAVVAPPPVASTQTPAVVAPPRTSPPPLAPKPVASPVTAAKSAESASPPEPAPPAVSRPPEPQARTGQPGKEGVDGSGAVDWLLKRQRYQPIKLD